MSAPGEPRLSADDIEAWASWQRVFAIHANLSSLQRKIDRAKELVSREIDRSKSPMLGWSGGKDSTALAHLVVVELGAKHVALVSEKDDLDYPGEEEYVRGLAERWNAKLELVRPDVSPAAWIESRATFMRAGDDIHSRSSGLSKACFYGVMERSNEGRDLVMMGLRAEESSRRAGLLKNKGVAYTLKNGTRRAHPLAFWTGQDVFAYLARAGVEPLHPYRCIGLMHRHAPWEIRKSWWLPGCGSAHGQYAWLRRYYPSLFERARRWFGNSALAQLS